MTQSTEKSKNCPGCEEDLHPHQAFTDCASCGRRQHRECWYVFSACAGCAAAERWVGERERRANPPALKPYLLRARAHLHALGWLDTLGQRWELQRAQSLLPLLGEEAPWLTPAR